MSISRRDFMKLFGISVASLMMTRCKPQFQSTTPHARLRTCWQQFSELAQVTQDISDDYDQYMDNDFGQQLIADHRSALDELVTRGEVDQPVADLVQEGYEAAIFHVWRSNIPVTCYEPMMVDYAPTSAQILVSQSEILGELAQEGEIDPATMALAQAALEHDLAFIALSDTEIDALYEQLVSDWQNQGEGIPAFDALPLELSQDVKAAARFIVELLTEE